MWPSDGPKPFDNDLLSVVAVSVSWLCCSSRASSAMARRQSTSRYWVDAALEMFGSVFGGATAYPKAQGIWRDDERRGALVKDEPIVVRCYTTPDDIQDSRNLAELGELLQDVGPRCPPGRGRVGGWR